MSCEQISLDDRLAAFLKFHYQRDSTMSDARRTAFPKRYHSSVHCVDFEDIALLVWAACESFCSSTVPISGFSVHSWLKTGYSITAILLFEGSLHWQGSFFQRVRLLDDEAAAISYSLRSSYSTFRDVLQAHGRIILYSLESARCFPTLNMLDPARKPTYLTRV